MRRSTMMGSGIFSLATAIALPQAAMAQMPASVPGQFAIPAGDLRRCISLYSRATGIQVVVAASDVAGRRGAAVYGRVTPRAALIAMLRGTGLVPVMRGNLVVLRRQAPPARAIPVAAAALAASEPVQEAAVEGSGQAAGKDIVVTGLRRSLESAIAAEATSILSNLNSVWVVNRLRLNITQCSGLQEQHASRPRACAVQVRGHHSSSR